MKRNDTKINRKQEKYRTGYNKLKKILKTVSQACQKMFYSTTFDDDT